MMDLLTSMPLETLGEYVKAETSALERAQSGLNQKRSTGIRRAYSSTQKFIVEFDRFLSAYSGIVEIVKSADQQYGGVAAATLSLLFSVSTFLSTRNSSTRIPPFHTRS